jgi:enoyl-CoA hydratase
MLVERERRGAVEILTLNRPESRNALSPELLAELGTALHEVLEDVDARVVILTGAGEKAFCAGMDLKSFGEGGGAPEQSPEAAEAQATFFKGEYPKPIVCAVNGAAVGGGFELVLISDLVVSVDDARFGLPEVKRGLYAAGGGTQLGNRIPLALALELGLTGEYVYAERALELGLINRVVSRDALLDTAVELAEKIAANGPLGVQLTKKLMRRGVARGAEAAMGSPEEMSAVFGSADATEGALAFMEKRDPVWTGR